MSGSNRKKVYSGKLMTVQEMRAFASEPEQESKGVNPHQAVERMSLEELRALDNVDAVLVHKAFGEDYEALGRYMDVVESARRRLTADGAILEASEQTARDAVDAVNKAKEQEAKIFRESRESEQKRLEEVVDVRKEFLTLQVDGFKTRCERALENAKGCYPAPYFGQNKALLDQQWRIKTMFDKAVQSIDSLAERGEPLNTEPFHKFIADQQDALTYKRLEKLEKQLAPRLDLARQQIQMLLNLYTSATRKEIAREDLIQELNNVTAGINNASNLEMLDAYNEGLKVKIQVVGERESTKSQERMELLQTAHESLKNCTERGLPEKIVKIHLENIHDLSLSVRETGDTRPFLDYINSLQELNQDLELMNEYATLDAFLVEKTVSNRIIPIFFSLESNPTGFLTSDQRARLVEDVEKSREEYRQAQSVLEEKARAQALADKLAAETNKTAPSSSGGMFGRQRSGSLNGFDSDEERPVVVHTAARKQKSEPSRQVPSGFDSNKSIDPNSDKWFLAKENAAGKGDEQEMSEMKRPQTTGEPQLVRKDPMRRSISRKGS